MSTEENVDIRRVERECQRSQEELSCAEAQLRRLREAAAPFHVGDIVVVTDRPSYNKPERTRRAIIDSVDAGSHWTWYKIRYAKKDGTWSQRVEHCYGKMEPWAGES